MRQTIFNASLLLFPTIGAYFKMGKEDGMLFATAFYHSVFGDFLKV